MNISRERFNEILREERVHERRLQDFFWNTFEKSAPHVDESQIRAAVERVREKMICQLIHEQLVKKHFKIT